MRKEQEKPREAVTLGLLSQKVWSYQKETL